MKPFGPQFQPEMQLAATGKMISRTGWQMSQLKPTNWRKSEAKADLDRAPIDSPASLKPNIGGKQEILGKPLKEGDLSTNNWWIGNDDWNEYGRKEVDWGTKETEWLIYEWNGRMTIHRLVRRYLNQNMNNYPPYLFPPFQIRHCSARTIILNWKVGGTEMETHPNLGGNLQSVQLSFQSHMRAF